MKRKRWQKLTAAGTCLGALCWGLRHALGVNHDAAAACYGSFTIAVIGVLTAYVAGNVGEHKVDPRGQP